MRSIRRSERLPVDTKALKFRVAGEVDYAELISSETEVVLAGERVLVYRPLDGVPEDLLEALESLKFTPEARTDGLLTNSRVLGFQPRVTLRRDFCTVAAMGVEQPGVQATFFNYARAACEVYREKAPVRYLRALAALDSVLPEWRIPGTVFTSGIVNQNNPLLYHYDAGNFKNVWSCMYALSRDSTGGHLVLPELGLAFSFAKPALIMFDGQSFLHGVTALKPHSRRAYRYSVVYYGLAQMRNCLTAKDELVRIKTVRVQRERKRGGL